MTKAKKLLGGAGLGALSIAAAVVARVLVRRWRMRRAPRPGAIEPTGFARTTAVGAHFPDHPGPLGEPEGAPARVDLGDRYFGGPNQQPVPGREER